MRAAGVNLCADYTFSEGNNTTGQIPSPPPPIILLNEPLRWFKYEIQETAEVT